MLIGLAGVTSTGKTTLTGSIKEEFGDRVKILDKISRIEIYQHMGHSEMNPDLPACSNEQRVIFDVGRCVLQMAKEREMYERYHDSANVKQPAIVIDGCAIVKAAYMIFLSGQFMKPETLDAMVHEVIDHCVTYYKSIFFLPVTRMPFTAADHRYFSSEYVRKGQDAILWRLLFREIGPRMDVNIFPTLDNNTVLDQLRKMGV